MLPVRISCVLKGLAITMGLLRVVMGHEFCSSASHVGSCDVKGRLSRKDMPRRAIWHQV